MFRPPGLFCICVFFIFAKGSQVQAKQRYLQEDGVKSNYRDSQDATSFVQKTEGLYLKGDNFLSADELPALPLKLAMTTLLHEYSPMANRRNIRRMSTRLSTQRRKLLQDYSPVANDRSPSNNRRRLLQDYTPVANDHSPPANGRRKLLEDYSPGRQ